MGNETKFSVIIPTIGRASLYETLWSIEKNGLLPGDEVIVVGDGPRPEAEFIVSIYKGERGMNVRYFELPAQTGIFGGPARNKGIEEAGGTHLLFMDDDDIYVPEAFEKMRKWAAEYPSKILLFKARAMVKRRPWDVVWKDKEIRLGNVTTQIFCLPRVKELIAPWPSRAGGDFAFLKATVERFKERDPEPCVWVDEVVAEMY